MGISHEDPMTLPSHSFSEWTSTVNRPNRDDLLQAGVANDQDDSYFAQGPNSIAYLSQIQTSRDLTASILLSWYPHHFHGNKPRVSMWIGAQMFHAALLTSQLIGDVGARPAKIIQTIATSQLHPVQIANLQMQALRRWQWLSTFGGWLINNTRWWMYSSGEIHFGMGTIVKVKKTNPERNSLSSRYEVVLLVLVLAVNLTQLELMGGYQLEDFFISAWPVAMSVRHHLDC